MSNGNQPQSLAGGMSPVAPGRTALDLLRDYGSVLGMLLVLGVIQVVKPAFLNPANLISVFKQSTILIILATGLTVSMILRGVDLSVAQVADAAGLIGAALIVHDQPAWLALLAPILFGFLIGGMNAALMAYLGVPAIIGTLGMMFLVRSGELIYSNGAQPQILFALPPAMTETFLFVGQGSVGPVPVLVVLTIVVVAIAYLLTQSTMFGRYMWAVGGNSRAAFLAGVDIRRVFGGGFIVSAVLSAIAGVVLASRAGIAAPRGAEPYLLDAFVAVYLGTLLSRKGQMSVLGAVGGALFVGLLGNGLTLMGLGAPYRYGLNGAFIILALGIGVLRRDY